MVKNNLFKEIPERLPNEVFDIIVSNKNVKIERIISDGHITPNNIWYDQDSYEFVILIKGGAEIEFENGIIESLKTGDYLTIAPHEKHRVIYTDMTGKTIWLAIHYHEKDNV